MRKNKFKGPSPEELRGRMMGFHGFACLAEATSLDKNYLTKTFSKWAS